VSYSRGAFRIAEQWLRVDSSYQEGSELESRDLVFYHEGRGTGRVTVDK
jgi:hypothetical protein